MEKNGGQAAPEDEAEEAEDFLSCTSCGDITDVTMESLFDSMGRNKRGTLRRGTRWMKNLSALVENWLCDSCLDKEELAQSSD